MKTLHFLSGGLDRFFTAFIGGLCGGLLAAWLFAHIAFQVYEAGVLSCVAPAEVGR